MKTYYGKVETPGSGGHPVYVAEGIGPELRLLSPRYDLANLSVGGFSWGYGGSGPLQLALAILADALGDNSRAVALHRIFMVAVVARLPRDEPWMLSDEDVIRVAGQLEVHFRTGSGIDQ